jgi:hypothetical protein
VPTAHDNSNGMARRKAKRPRKGTPEREAPPQMTPDHVATLRIRRQTGETIEAQGTFPEKEWRILARFTEYADQLRQNLLGRQGAAVSFTVRGETGSGLEYEVALPTDDELGAFLHRLRPFVLPKERTAFSSVTEILRRRLVHPVALDVLSRHHALFAGESFQSLFTVTINDLIINSEEALRLWLNGFEYHRDEDKRAALEALAPVMPLEAARAIFINMMLDKSTAVREVAGMIRVLIESRRAG